MKWTTVRLRGVAARLFVLSLFVALSVAPSAAANPPGGVKLLPEFGDWFGGSVSLDGETLVVGAAYHTHAGRGAAYVYQFTNGEWIQTTELHASDPQLVATFGNSVALDGATIVVGDPDRPIGSVRSPGAAYVFQKGAAGWTQVAELVAETPTNDARFGSLVALSGSTAFVSGGGGVTVFENVGGAWARQGTLHASVPDGFGLDGEYGGAMAIDGNLALIGASSQDARAIINSGAVFAYERDATGWHETGVIAAPDPVWRGQFGYSLDLSATTAIMGRPGGSPAAGGPYRGVAYIYEKIGDKWVESATLEPSDGFPGDTFGSRVAISGDLAAVSTTNGDGRVYLFAKKQGAWEEIGRLGTGMEFNVDQFGISLSLDEGKLALGARLDGERGHWAGAAYVVQVPEPHAWSLGTTCLGAALFAGARRKRARLNV